MSSTLKPETIASTGGRKPTRRRTPGGADLPDHLVRLQRHAHAARLFGLQEFGNIYTRIMNRRPTCSSSGSRSWRGHRCARVASGQAAETLALLNIARAGDEIVSSASSTAGRTTFFPIPSRGWGSK